MDVKSREREFESPNAEAVSGPTRRNPSRADGVASARIDWSAFRVNGSE